MLKIGKHEIRTPSICASIIGEDIDSMEKGVNKALEGGAELLELRLDKLKDLNGWESLLRKDIPTIVTNRSKREGGYFEGNEKDRNKILLEAINKGASCVDIELSSDSESLNEVVSLSKKKRKSVLISFHDFEKTPKLKELIEIKEDMIEAGCDIAKIIGYAKTPEDSLRSLNLLIKTTKRKRIPILSFTMGEIGGYTRLASMLLGSPFTYASVGEKTAPGQFQLEAMKKHLDKFRT